jgi:hypothetical protein
MSSVISVCLNLDVCSPLMRLPLVFSPSVLTHKCQCQDKDRTLDNNTPHFFRSGKNPNPASFYYFL